MNGLATILKPIASATDLDSLFDRGTDFASACSELVGLAVVVLKKAQNHVNAQYKRATASMKARCLAAEADGGDGVVSAAGHTFYLKAAAPSDTYDVDSTYNALIDAGCTEEQVYDALSVNAKKAALLCEAFKVDPAPLRVRKMKARALQVTKA